MITNEQRERLTAVINRTPTNPPSPRLTVTEIDELRALVANGREDDAWAELCARANAAMSGMWEAIKKASAEAGREMARERRERVEHVARMAVLVAQKAAISPVAADTAAIPSGATDNAAPAFRPKIGWQIALFDSWLEISKNYRHAPSALEAAKWLRKNDDSGFIIDKGDASSFWWKPQRGAEREVPAKTIQNVISKWKVAGVLPT